MKNIKNLIPFIGSLALANLAGAAEKLTIESAHALPDYIKLTPATGDISARIFIVAFAVGDFNEDGRLDLVVQTGGPDIFPLGARVYLQGSNGAFTEKIEYILPTTGITWDFVPGDFNEDGHLDILMEDSDHDMVMMLGKGDGTFREPTFLGLSAAGYFAVADLNGDKHLDLVAGKLDGTVGVFAGAGDGTFSLKSTLDTQVTPSYPRAGEIMLGDLNGDGKADVAVASRQDATGLGNLDVFLGNGDGTFQGVIRTPNLAVRRGALGDFNGDGILDFAGDRGSPEQLEIWLGQGNGHFTKGKVYSLSGVYNFASGIKVADLNHDDIADVIVSGEMSSTVYAGPLSIFLGNGDGTFQPRQSFTQANNAMINNAGPQLLDFDRDGLLDILSLCWTSETRPNPEALTIALSKGVRREVNLGFLLKVQNSAPSAASPLVLESSTNLVNWTALTTNAAPTVLWPVVDTSAGLQQRFYRTRRQ